MAVQDMYFIHCVVLLVLGLFIYLLLIVFMITVVLIITGKCNGVAILNKGCLK